MPCFSHESKSAEEKFMSLSSTDKGLLTPDNCAVIFIDHQPQMFFGVANIDRQGLLNCTDRLNPTPAAQLSCPPGRLRSRPGGWGAL